MEPGALMKQALIQPSRRSVAQHPHPVLSPRSTQAAPNSLDAQQNPTKQRNRLTSPKQTVSLMFTATTNPAVREEEETKPDRSHSVCASMH